MNGSSRAVGQEGAVGRQGRRRAETVLPTWKVPEGCLWSQKVKLQLQGHHFQNRRALLVVSGLCAPLTLAEPHSAEAGPTPLGGPKH